LSKDYVKDNIVLGLFYLVSRDKVGMTSNKKKVVILAIEFGILAPVSLIASTDV